MNKGRVEELARLSSMGTASEEAQVTERVTEFVVLSHELLTSSDREVLADLGYVIFYENNLVSRLFGVRNESGSVEELDELTFVEKASYSTKDHSEIMGLEVDV